MGQCHIGQRECIGEERRYLRIGEASYSAPYAGYIKVEFLMLAGKVDELIHIGFDGFHAALHSGYSITLSLQSNALAPYGPEAVDRYACSSTHVHAIKVTAEHEHLIVAQ